MVAPPENTSPDNDMIKKRGINKYKYKTTGILSRKKKIKGITDTNDNDNDKDGLCVCGKKKKQVKKMNK